MKKETKDTSSLAPTKWNCRYSISLTLKFSVSVCELHVSPFLEYQQYTFAFQISRESWNAPLGQDAHQPMYVIRTYFSPDYLDTFLPLA